MVVHKQYHIDCVNREGKFQCKAGSRLSTSCLVLQTVSGTSDVYLCVCVCLCVFVCLCVCISRCVKDENLMSIVFRICSATHPPPPHQPLPEKKKKPHKYGIEY
jgi:hypothetical protein